LVCAGLLPRQNTLQQHTITFLTIKASLLYRSHPLPGRRSL